MNVAQPLKSLFFFVSVSILIAVRGFIIYFQFFHMAFIKYFVYELDIVGLYFSSML